MGKIQLLNETVASRIAAGEVVERPASIVKELLENAIDAHATAISVSITEGGVREIRVSDNGEGIAAEDMPLTIVKHATSKIFTLEDLEHINSMGFRGEALASIAAVSMLTIKSRQADSTYGSELYARGGKVEYIRKAGLADGTTVIVENLFYNTPARLKFLKKPGAEASLISDIIARLILANPQISFRYTVSNKVIYHSPGNGKLIDAIYSVYGFEMKQALIPVDFRFNQIYLQGFIGEPSNTFKTQKYGTLLVNNRYVKNIFVQRAIQRAYGERLLKNSYPFYVLNLVMPTEDVDVNVHPNKLAVHFRDENELEYVLVNAVEQALRTAQKPPILSLEKEEAKKKDERKDKDIEESPFTVEQGDKSIRSFGDIPRPQHEHNNINSHIGMEQQRVHNSSAKPMISSKENQQIDEILRIASEVDLKKQPLSLHEAPVYVSDDTLKEFDMTFARIKKKEEELQKKEEKKQALDMFADRVDFKIIGVAFNTYIIIECGNTLYLIDQHAAHERKIYDGLMHNIAERPISQYLLSPIRVEITAAERFLLLDNLEIISAMGFSFERIEETFCEIIAYPQILGDTDIRQTLQDMIGNLEMGDTSIQVRKDKIAKGACKRAIKAGMQMSESDIRDLVETILQSNTIPHCPHGRPLAIALTKIQLEDGFKRRV